MRIFFRKHGSSIFYIVLPVFFLLLTVSLIEFTPRFSKSFNGVPCNDGTPCCNTSGCGLDSGEICVTNKCRNINLGCPVGVVNDGPEGCTCVDNNDQVVGDCTVCPSDEIFFEGACEKICGPGEDPIVNNCIEPGCFEGSGFNNDSNNPDCNGWSGCALHPAATSQGGLAFYLLALLPLALGVLRLRSRQEHP